MAIQMEQNHLQRPIEPRACLSTTEPEKETSRSHMLAVVSRPSISFLLGEDQQRKCALAMKHADVWYEMAERKVRLGLILEDDVIFVPFFKENSLG